MTISPKKYFRQISGSGCNPEHARSKDENTTRAHSPLLAAGSSKRIEIVSLHFEAPRSLPRGASKHKLFFKLFYGGEMKKIIPVLFILLFISTMSAHAEDVHQAVIDGYGWENLSEQAKIPFMYGFVAGYRYGWLDGYDKGINHDVKKLQESKRIEAEDIDVLKENIGFYSHEVDSFLKTYPSCRRLEISALLMRLAYVWNEKHFLHTDYKNIGRDCSKRNK